MILATAALALLAQSGPAVPSGQLPLQPGEVRRLLAADFAPATSDEVAEFVEMQFTDMDRNKSGFIERDEAPDQGVQFTDARWEGEGVPPREWLEKQEFRPLPVEPVMARAAFLAQYDTDADGRVNREEYRARTVPNTLRSGLPKRWLEERRSRS